MKKFFAVLFGLLIGGALLQSPVFAGSFPDVPEDYKNYHAIEYLDEQQIINGYSDGTFKPDNPVNRAEALKMISEALNLADEASAEGGTAYDVLFPDVLKEDWFFNYVMAAQTKGIVSGYSDSKFKPANNVNLAETLKMLLTSANVTLPTVSSDVFVDVPKDAWFAPYSAYAREHNIILADDYGTVAPAQMMTRGAFAEVVYRMMIVKDSGGEAFPLHLNWTVYVSRILPFKIKYDNQNWTLTEHTDEVIFLKPDREFLQFSSTRVYPNTAITKITVDENEIAMTADQYFLNIKNAFTGANYTEFNFGGGNVTAPSLEVLYPEQRIVDWYIYLPDNKVLVVYTQYGSGLSGFQFQQIIKAMLGTLEYNEVGTGEDFGALLSQIFENILIEDKGMQMLDLLPDKTIIETDTIGVGTGPVDYYYSEGVNYTFKYERGGDIILDSREGRTTAF